MTQIAEQTLNTMISSAYVPHWGKWHVIREIHNNSKDADPEGYRMEVEPNPDGDDVIRFVTTTSPQLDHLAIMGAGTKDRTTDDVGQFGEGWPLSAMVACRENLKFSMQSPHGRFEPYLDTANGFVTETLHIDWLSEETPSEDCVIELVGPGLCEAMEGRILPHDTPYGAIGFDPATVEKQKNSMRVYLRGSYVSEIPEKSLWDWNQEFMDINRDREMVDGYTFAVRVRCWLKDHLTLDLIRVLFKYHASFEGEAFWRAADLPEEARVLLASVFYGAHGEDAVIATAAALANNSAETAGKKPVWIPNSHLRRHLALAGIPVSKEYLTDERHLVKIETVDEYTDQLHELRDLADAIREPIDFYIVKDVEGRSQLSGVCNGKVWLSEKLFMAGNRHNRVQQFLNSVRELTDGQHDVSARLAVAYLDLKGASS